MTNTREFPEESQKEKSEIDGTVAEMPGPKADRKPWLKLYHGTDRPYCGHRCGVLLDLDAREVECGGCGAVLDPYDVLNRICRDEESMVYSVANKRALIAQINELKKEETRIKARIKRARSKEQAQCPTRENI